MRPLGQGNRLRVIIQLTMALQPGGSSSHPIFAQNGQVDWVAFGNTAWNMTTAVLQRFSTAEIKPATYGTALAVGGRFHLGSKGCRRVNSTLQRLKGTGSFRKMLWFGFGRKSFIHFLAEH